jgi:hypothetical protein
MANHHLVTLVDLNPFSLNQLEVPQARDNFMLNPEPDFHPVIGAFLDGKRLFLEIFQSFGGAKVNDDIWAAFNQQRKLEDHSL